VHIFALFLLLVLEKSVISIDFRSIGHSISAREDGNTVFWKAMAQKKTDDDSVTYWFPWKHPMARRRGLEFGIFDQMTPKMGSSAWPCGPCHSSLLAPLHENTTQMWARPCGSRLSSIANAPGPNFSPFRCPPRSLGHAALDSDHAECLWSRFGSEQ